MTTPFLPRTHEADEATAKQLFAEKRAAQFLPELAYVQPNLSGHLRGQISRLLSRHKRTILRDLTQHFRFHHAWTEGVLLGIRQPELAEPFRRLLELHRTRAGRDGQYLLLFLERDDPRRAEILEEYLKHSRHARFKFEHLDLIGLYPEEVERVAEILFGFSRSNRSLTVLEPRFATFPEKLRRGRGGRTLLLGRNGSLGETLAYARQLRDATDLVLSTDNLTADANDWTALPPLTRLEFRGSRLTVDRFDFLDALPHLEELCLDQNTVSHPAIFLRAQPVPLGYEDCQGWNFTDFDLRHAHLPRINAVHRIGAAVVRDPSIADKAAFLNDLLHRNHPDGPRHAGFLLAANLDAMLNEDAYADLKNHPEPIAELEKRLGTVVLHIPGKTILPKRELHQKLTAMGWIVARNADDPAVNAVLMTRKLSDPTVFARRDWAFVHEPTLNAALPAAEDAYLVQTEENAGLTESVRQLLLSSSDDGVAVALELLRKGGVPRELEPLIVLRTKGTATKKLRTKLLQLMRRYGDPAWQPFLRSSYSYEFSDAMPYRVVFEHLLLQAYKKGVRGKHFAELTTAIRTHLRPDLGTPFSILEDGDPLIGIFLQEVVSDDGTFNFPQTVRPGKPDTDVPWYYANRRFQLKLPDCPAAWTDRIPHLDISGCNWERLPKAVRTYRGLRTLDVSHNLLTKLPDWLGELPHLARVNVAQNIFQQTPELPGVELLGVDDMATVLEM